MTEGNITPATPLENFDAICRPNTWLVYIECDDNSGNCRYLTSAKSFNTAYRLGQEQLQNTEPKKRVFLMRASGSNLFILPIATMQVEILSMGF